MSWRLQVLPALGLAAGLAACAPLQVHRPGTPDQLAGQVARERLLAAQPDWGLDARFAASDGRRGGSGSLEWTQRGDAYRFILRAPITGKSVRLEGGPDGAVLAGLDGGPLTGASAGSVLNEAFGWRVPVADLAYWVRGLRAPDKPAVLTFGANGLPATLDQDGWRVDYREWYTQRSPPLPRKVYASRVPYTVRVLIQGWKLAQ